MLRVHERTDLGFGVVRVADHDLSGWFGVAFDEFVVDRAFDEDTAAGGAAFTVEGEHAEQRGVERGVQVGVGEHDGG